MPKTELTATPPPHRRHLLSIAYPEKLPEILSALCKHLSVNDGIDFILHGGDMIDSTTEDHIVAAARAFDLAVPVYLCLGNHDLPTPDAVDLWLEFASSQIST